MCLVTKQAPEFEAEAVMPNNSFETLSLSSYRVNMCSFSFIPWTLPSSAPRRF